MSLSVFTKKLALFLLFKARLSDVFVAYVTKNMQHPVWVSEVLREGELCIHTCIFHRSETEESVSLRSKPDVWWAV